MPFDLFEKLKNQGIFEGLSVNVQSKTKDVSNLSGILYRNDDVNFTIEIPLNWYGKYIVESTSNNDTDILSFKQKATYEKYGEGSGVLFYIERNKTGVDGNIGNQKLLFDDGKYNFIIGLPTDIQYPIWSGRDEEDMMIAAEYEDMAKDIDNIEKSFDTIVKYRRPPLYN